MSDEYPFDLQGPQENFWGTGQKDGETEVSDEFYLQQGIVIAEIEHWGHGDIKLEFVSTTVGELKRAALNFLGLRRRVWTPVDDTGEFKSWFVVRVGEYDGALVLGKYRLEVESKDRWTCQFIQPDLDQPLGPLEDDDGYDGDDGTWLVGPLKSGSRPLLAALRHDGRGEFIAIALSIDGTHSCVVFEEDGQFQVEDHQTEIKLGKEYMLYIISDGPWSLKFTEGY